MTVVTGTFGSGHADEAARDAVANDLDTTLVVEAAAGTGKTTELVKRIVNVLARGHAKIGQIVAVTFTEKAAGELKLRVREELEKKRAAEADPDRRAALEDALEHLEEAQINTIHGFCAELLRERPVEARVDPLFAVLTEPQARRIYARAFRGWLEHTLQDPPEGVRRALRRTSGFGGVAGGMDEGPIDRLRGAGWTLADSRFFAARWRRPLFDRLGEIDRLVAALHQLAGLSADATSPRDYLYIDTDGVRRLSRQIQLEQSFGGADYDGWEARLVDLVRDRGFSRTRKGSGFKYGKSVTRTQVVAAREALYADLQQFKRDADADLAAALQQELAGATDRYQRLKDATGALDFADLLVRARDLIAGDASVRNHLQRQFTRIFVDEFQDTDPIQAEILLLLADDVPGKLFIVGDPKQAIYRFRGTDVGTYWAVKRQLAARGARVLQLTTSYRSVPAIQRFVNAAFRDEMVGDEATLQADYIPLAPSRRPCDTQPAIVALPVPRPYSRRGPLKPSAKAIEESLPDAVGAFIAWLVDARHGWTVSERQADGSDARVAIQPRHIAVLFRRFASFGEDVTRPYVDAIEARSIPHLLVGGKAFHDREEVETVRAALAAIEWPDDELSVFATLKGSLFAIDDEHLLEYRERFGIFHPFRIAKELGGNSGSELALSGEPVEHLIPIAEALRALQQLHRRRNYRPVADTIGRLLTETRAHVGFILRPAGEQALANVLHVAELARQYEASGGISFRGFIDELRRAADNTDTAEAPILEEGSDGVRLMTVHKAKGLEFPVVILADLTCRISRGDASRYLDAPNGLCAMKIGGWAPHELHDHEAEEVARDQAEGVRLAYVAATRARDLLVVPALGDGAWEGGWFSPLNRAIYPPLAARRTAARGSGCPTFRSKDSVIERPNDEAAGAATVCPGQHTFADHSVVWWDPTVLDLGKKPSFGVRRGELIVKDVPRDVVADGRSKYDRWHLARADARDGGSIPSVLVETVRQWSGGESAALTPMSVAPADVRVVDIRGDRPDDVRDAASRPGGAPFGVLVHTLLALAPLDSTDADQSRHASLQEAARREARLLGLTDRHATVAAEIVARVLQHDLMMRARAAAAHGVCRRETPVTWTLQDGTLVEGIADLAFEEPAGWTVVDYKTDREIALGGEDRYRRQIALYASAIAAATARPVAAVLVRL